MSKYISDKTIKEMTKVGKVVKDANILILGLTFKEDCPDIRNTRVADIISELEEFGANVDVYDPLIDSKQMNNRYKIITDPLKSNKKYDAIIVTVSHKQFKAYTSNDYSRLSSDDKIIIDIKNIVENPTWKL